MKHILNTVCFLAVVLLAAGCRDTGHDVSETPTFEVVNADISYTASGGSGIIELKLFASASPTVEVSKDWCHATVSGNKINVTVDGHGEFFSRESQLIITVNGYKRVLGIYQGGVVIYANDGFGELGYNKDDELRIPLTREGIIDLQLTNYSSWVNASIEGDEIVVRALVDNGLTKKEGYITMKVGKQVKTISFVQTEYPLVYSAYLGEWTMTYMSAINYGGEQLSADLVFAVNEEGKSFKVTGLGSYVMIFTYNEGQLRFNVGDKVGTYTTGGVTFNTQIAMLTVAGGYNASSTTLHWLSSYEIVNSKLVVRFTPSNASYSSAFGIGYYNASSSWAFFSGRRYYADVVFYKK